MDIFVLENKNNTIMAKFKAKMDELGSDGKVKTLEQTAVCESEQQVIEFYGLKEPDILEYSIEEIKD